VRQFSSPEKSALTQRHNWTRNLELSDFDSNASVEADGYIVTWSAYGNEIYCIGIGPSAAPIF